MWKNNLKCRKGVNIQAALRTQHWGIHVLFKLDRTEAVGGSFKIDGRRHVVTSLCNYILSDTTLIEDDM